VSNETVTVWQRFDKGADGQWQETWYVNGERVEMPSADSPIRQLDLTVSTAPTGGQQQ
jgi:hypothetical protein